MTGRRQRILALALVAAGATTLGSAAGGLAGTDRELTAAVRAAEIRMIEDRDRECPLRERERKAPRPDRPEL